MLKTVLRNKIMRKIYLFILFFSVFQYEIQSQTMHGILIESTLSDIYGRYGSNRGNQRVTIGTSSILKNYNTTTAVRIEYDFFYVNDNPILLICQSSMDFNQERPNCNSDVTIPFNKDHFTNYEFDGCIGNSKIMGIHLEMLNPSNRTVDELITLENGWNWQYSYDTIWVDFDNSFQDKRQISFKINELQNYIGKKFIHFRTGYKTQYTNIVTYDIDISSPKLATAPVVTNPNCSYDKGNVTFTFESPLDMKEGDELDLYCSSIDEATLKNTVVKYNQIVNNSYVLDNLDENNYKFSYQVRQKEGAITSLEPKVGEKNTFTITPPDPLKFTATKKQDVLCNGGDTGEIEIEILSGIGPYRFFVDNAEKTATLEGGKYIIRELSTNQASSKVYNVKVTANGCVEKNP
ncbi:hypothetical protein SAMN05444355_1244 [Flavobacterium frigoris]|uniref:SprB repeat-containing protein n=2 Tax=Flavobacterium frigoris TaxID=229204 RepID=A0A1H9RV29_FLAFI|nr:hypothetical protein SAMN05444355_1244 [Flavobacterium frigoris]